MFINMIQVLAEEVVHYNICVHRSNIAALRWAAHMSTYHFCPLLERATLKYLLNRTFIDYRLLFIVPKTIRRSQTVYTFE